MFSTGEEKHRKETRKLGKQQQWAYNLSPMKYQILHYVQNTFSTYRQNFNLNVTEKKIIFNLNVYKELQPITSTVKTDRRFVNSTKLKPGKTGR